MPTLKETIPKVIHLPDTSYIDDLETRKAIDALSQAVTKIWDTDHTEEFLELVNTSKFKKIIERQQWKFIRKNFSQEKMVKDIEFENSRLKANLRKYYVLPNDVPGQEHVEFLLSQLSFGAVLALGTNDSDTDIDVYKPIKLKDSIPLVGGPDTADMFAEKMPEFTIEAADSNTEVIAITQEPIRSGGTGIIMLQGVSPVLIDVNQNYDKYLVPVDEGNLQSSSRGQSRILWKDRTGGQSWAVAFINGCGSIDAHDGYFKVERAGDDFVTVVDLNDELGSICGIVYMGDCLLRVPTPEPMQVVEDSFVILDPDNLAISLQSMTDPFIYGILLGRVYLLPGGGIKTVQEHSGMVTIDKYEPFRVSRSATVNSINMNGGDFILNNKERTISGSDMQISASGTVYITVSDDDAPVFNFGSMPAFDDETANIPIAYVYFENGRVCKVDQYILGWFCYSQSSGIKDIEKLIKSLSSKIGYFSITSNASNKVTVCDRFNPDSSYCGFIYNGFTQTGVYKTTLAVNVDSYIYLDTVSNEIIAEVALHNYDRYVLLGRVYIISDPPEGETNIGYVQDHIGIISYPIPEPFDIVRTDVNAVMVKGGSFRLDGKKISCLETVISAIAITSVVYIEADKATGEGIIKAASVLPGNSGTIVNVPIGKIYFANDRVATIEQYQRGWFSVYYSAEDSLAYVKNGYFTLKTTETINEIRIVDAYSPASATCGYIFDGVTMKPVLSETFTISEPVHFILNLDLATISMQPASLPITDGILLGRANLIEDVSSIPNVHYSQDFTGLAIIKHPEPFDLIQIDNEDNNLNVIAGQFMLDGEVENTEMTNFALTETSYIYVEIGEAIAVKSSVELPEDTTLVKNVVLGKVYYDTKITRIEQYIRGWFEVSTKKDYGYFHVVDNGNGTINVIDGHDEASVNCGYIKQGAEMLPVVKHTITIPESVNVVLVPETQQINIYPAAHKFYGILLARVFHNLVDEIVTLNVVQEHKGLVTIHEAVPFDIVYLSETGVNIVGGFVDVGGKLREYTSSNLVISGDTEIYLEIPASGSIVVKKGDAPTPTTDTSYIVLGAVTFANGRITGIEQYVRGRLSTFAVPASSGGAPFEISRNTDTSVTVTGGSFRVNNVLQTLVSGTLTMSGSCEIYTAVAEDVSPTLQTGTAPSPTETMEYVKLGYVGFSDGKITEIKQYVLGWFHCHTWGDCESSTTA